ncbi:MAG TPA: hypothetical protein DEP42_02190, partial [Ruminococcaceae bacterium]|nr:hypothetical protein [Oscillospiraceae bacterium]
MAKIGVLSAMPVEIEGILQDAEDQSPSAPNFYQIWKRKLGDNTVYFSCSGIGKVNAAACAQHLIDVFHVDCIINMGIAGGIAKDLHTLDVVIGGEVFYHDYTPDTLLKKYYPFQNRYTCDKKLQGIASSVCRSTPEVAHFRIGNIASGDCFVEAKDTKDHIREDLDGVCCEME